MKNEHVLISLLVLLAVVSFYTFLIMTIWNKVIIEKFPQQKIEKLSFVEALALSVFVSILSGPTIFSSAVMHSKLLKK